MLCMNAITKKKIRKPEFYKKVIGQQRQEQEDAIEADAKKRSRINPNPNTKNNFKTGKDNIYRGLIVLFIILKTK